MHGFVVPDHVDLVLLGGRALKWQAVASAHLVQFRNRHVVQVNTRLRVGISGQERGLFDRDIAFRLEVGQKFTSLGASGPRGSLADILGSLFPVALELINMGLLGYPLRHIVLLYKF
jgi:hypothetical protein